MSQCNLQLQLDLGIKNYDKILSEGRTVASDGTSYVTSKAVLELAKEAENVEEAKAVLLDRLNGSDYHNKVKALLTEDLTVRYEYNGNLQGPLKATLVDVSMVRDDNGNQVAKVKLVDENGKYSTYFYDTNGNQDEYSQKHNGSRVRITNSYNVFHKAKRYADSLVWQYDYATLSSAENVQRAKELVDLGSKTTETVLDLNRYAKEKSYEHGNIANMKAMLDKVNMAGGKKASEKYLNRIKELYDTFHPHFFHKMDLRLNMQADEAQGWVALDRDMILIDVDTKNKRDVDMTNAEVLAEETVHTMVAFAFRNGSTEAGRLKRQVRYLMQQVQEKTSWKNLLPEGVDPNNATNTQVARAKALYNYVFTSKNAEEEFIAKGLTNPRMMKHLESLNVKEGEAEGRTLYEKLVGMLTKIMDVVLGKYDFSSSNTKADKQLLALAIGLGEVNWKGEQYVAEQNVLAKVNNWVNDVDQELADKLQDFLDKYVKDDAPLERLPKDATAVQQTMYIAKFMMKAAVNENYAKAMSMFTENMLKQGASSTLQEFFSSVMGNEDDVKKAANWLKLQNDMIDNARNSVISATENQIRSKFKEQLTEADAAAVTRALIDTNLGHLAYHRANGAGVNNQLIREWLTDDKKLLNRIYEVKKKIEERLKDDKKRANFITAQAHGLGYYMATGLGNEVQNLNAFNIVRGIHTENRYKVDEHLLADVMELSTLNAVRYTDGSYRNALARLMKDEYEGIREIANTYEAFKRDSKNELFEDNKIHMIDGYSRELIDSTIVQQVVPISKREEMEYAGYEYKGPVKGHSAIKGERLGLFVSQEYTRTERLRGAMPLGGYHAKGSSLKDRKMEENAALGPMMFERDMVLIGQSGRALVEKMQNGTFNPAKDSTGVLPTLNLEGRVIDYRYEQSKLNKETNLNQDLDAVRVMAMSMGSIVDKSMREAHSKRMLKFVQDTMAEEWTEGELGNDTITKFLLIGPNAPTKEGKELYQLLPENFRQWINSRADKTMAIPENIKNIMFGYTHMSIGNADMLKFLPTIARKILKQFENLWIDLIKIVKSNILIRLPWIIMTNILSNLIYMNNTGMSFSEIWEYHKESFRDVKEFMRLHKEAVDLGIEVKKLKQQARRVSKEKADKLKEEIDKKEAAIAMKEKMMKTNPVNELVESGMFQTIVEDIETSALNDNNAITQFADRVTGKFPGVIRSGLRILYMSRETKWAQVSTEALQLSDLIARDVMNRKQKKIELMQANGEKKLPREFREWYKETRGVTLPETMNMRGETRELFLKMAKESRHYNLLKSFINYSQPNGKFEEYLNRVGLLMFTKYVKNIQRIVVKTGSEHPIQTMKTLLMFQWLFNQDTIQDQAFLVKGFGADGEFSPTNIFPVYTPDENLITAINPPLINLGMELYGSLKR